jgi:hypothetical protein
MIWHSVKARIARKGGVRIDPCTAIATARISVRGPDCVETRMFEGRSHDRCEGTRSYARIASINPPTPRMLITLFMRFARGNLRDHIVSLGLTRGSCPMSQLGQSLPTRDIRTMSAFHPRAATEAPMSPADPSKPGWTAG